jgi:hypothetical protein
MLSTLGIVNNVLKLTLVQRQSTLNVCNISYLITLNAYEIFTLKQGDIRRLRASKMKFMKNTAGYNLLDHRRNEDILELKVDPVTQ